MKKELIQSIREKEIQLAKLKEHVDKSAVCSDLYNKVVLEKAILKKEDSIKAIIPRKKTLICDYFKK